MKPRQFSIGSKEEDEYASQCVTIEPLSINEDYTRLPANLHYWNGQYTNAVEAALEAKARREALEADLRVRLRRDADAGNITEVAGRVTETLLDALITKHPEYQSALAGERKAEVRKSKVAGVVESIRAAKEMLISLGAHLRHEQEPQINSPGHRRRGYERTP